MTAPNTTNFRDVNSNGNANNNNASGAYGCAPDSVRHAASRSLATDVSATEGDPFLPPVSPFMARWSNYCLDAPGWTLLAWGQQRAFMPFHTRWRHAARV